MEFTITSPAFNNNTLIPSIYTCDGRNISPPLEWCHIPDETKSLVLIMDDPDAPRGTWVHWIVYNIPVGITKFEEGIKKFPGATNLGINSWQRKEYGGPCPPSGEHRYYFKLYALNIILSINKEFSKHYVENAMVGHIVGQTILIGRYARINTNKD